MRVVSHTGIILYTEGRATEGAWLDNNVGVVSMIILHRGAGYVKLLCIIVYYIYNTHIRECTIDGESLSSSPITTSTITSHILLYTIKIILE